MFKAKECEYVIFDVETTGLNPQDGDRIIEIAAIKIKNGQKTGEFEQFINPQRPLSLSAMDINKITEDMVADAPTHDVVLPQFMDFVAGACLVAHNASFDIKFVCYELALIGRRLNKCTPVLDTMKLARGLLPHLGSYRLGYLAHSFGVPVQETHRALADVGLTVSVFQRLLDVAGDQQCTQFDHLMDQFSVEKPNFKIEEAIQDTLF